MLTDSPPVFRLRGGRRRPCCDTTGSLWIPRLRRLRQTKSLHVLRCRISRRGRGSGSPPSLGLGGLGRHDYGGIVGQELIESSTGRSTRFTIDSVVALNFGIVSAPTGRRAYRSWLILRSSASCSPTASPPTGSAPDSTHSAGQGSPMPSSTTSARHLARRRPQAGASAHPLQRRTSRPSPSVGDGLANWDRPLRLVWGLADPVSGRHVLEKATTLLRAPR